MRRQRMPAMCLIDVDLFKPGNEPQAITVSIGIAAMTAERATCSRMMAAAAARYRTKSQGRNQACIQD